MSTTELEPPTPSPSPRTRRRSPRHGRRIAVVVGSPRGAAPRAGARGGGVGLLPGASPGRAGRAGRRDGPAGMGDEPDRRRARSHWCGRFGARVPSVGARLPVHGRGLRAAEEHGRERRGGGDAVGPGRRAPGRGAPGADPRRGRRPGGRHQAVLEGTLPGDRDRRRGPVGVRARRREDARRPALARLVSGAARPDRTRPHGGDGPTRSTIAPRSSGSSTPRPGSASRRTR